MSDQIDRQRKEALRGDDAVRVLESPAFQAAMEAMHKQVQDEWLKCPIRDVEGQRLLLQLAKVAQMFQRQLTGMVETGKLAQHELDKYRNESPVQKLFRRVI